MAEQFGDKSHEATPHRRQQAREEGQVARSQDLASAVLLLGAVLLVMAYATTIAETLGRYTVRQLGGPAWLSASSNTATSEFTVALQGLATVVTPVLGLLLALAVIVNVGQTGWLFLPKKLAFDINRVNPWKGLQRLFSLVNLVRLSFGIFKVLVVSVVAVWSLWSEHEAILSLAALPVREIAAFVFQMTVWTTLKIAGALLVLAILDYAFQRWKHDQDLRMTDQEIREEMKNLQGDPQILARRRAVQRQLVMNRLSSAVPKGGRGSDQPDAPGGGDPVRSGYHGCPRRGRQGRRSARRADPQTGRSSSDSDRGT